MKFCSNCRLEIDRKTLSYRRGKAALLTVCADCVAVVKVDSSYGECWAHVGDFDADENPLNRDGVLLLPGFRCCGNADCVNAGHILHASEFERIDTSYVTGVRRSPAEVMARLQDEAKRRFPSAFWTIGVNLDSVR